MSRSATSHDVAREAGVSRTTVSYVLNNAESVKISEDTRERVLAAAQKVGYLPNQAAKAVKTGRFGCIALLLGRDIYLPKRLLMGINEAVAERSIHLSVANIYKSCGSDELQPAVLRQLIADGILVNSNEEITADIRAIRRSQDMPLIWLNQRMKRDCIYPDDRSAARQATEHLISLGHRRILYVYAGAANRHYSHTDRAQGYEEAMQEARLTPLPYSTHTEETAGAERITALRGLLRARQRPTAVLAYSWPSAAAAHTAALLEGLRIPQDLSLITFEDEQKDFGVGIEITTLQIPWHEIGQRAVELLLGALARAGKSGAAVAVPYGALRPGESCQPPAGRG